MRRRGPTVPRSSAKLGDSQPGEGDAVIASTWRLSLSADDASTSTDPIRKTDQRVQSYGTAELGVQTEGSALTRQGEISLEALSESGKQNLLAFLEAAVPQMERALAENEQSATFDDGVIAAAALEDDTARAPECVHALDPRPSTSSAAGPGDATGSDSRGGGEQTRDERFWRDLVPTGVSWNRSGFSIAVSYGRFDVTGWCDSPGALCVWNLRREDVDPRKPDHTFETDSCLQCVAFHPSDPAVVAAGSFDGEVYVWDIRGDGDGDGKENRDGTSEKTRLSGGDCLVARSAVSDASHREPIVALHWLKSAHAAGTRAGRGGVWTHDVCSFGSDGRVLVWDFSRAETVRGETNVEESDADNKKKHAVRRVPFPSFGYETKVGGVNEATFGNAKSSRVVRGIAAASFFAALGGGHDVAKTHSASGSSSFLLGCDEGAVLECLMRHGASTDAGNAFARECALGSVPVMKSPATAEYEPHKGAAHGVCAHPSDNGVFLSCGADGALKLYARRLRRKIARLEPKAGALFCAAWSPSRPALIACGTSHGTVVLYDLLEGLGSVDARVRVGGSTTTDHDDGSSSSFGGLASLNPTAELRGCRVQTPTQALAFNDALPEYLAAADGNAVRVWDLGARFAVPRTHEAAAIKHLADGGEEG